MTSVPKRKLLFEVKIDCTVRSLKVNLSGVDHDCETFGPYIGPIHLVERLVKDDQPCYPPFIHSIKVGNVCEITLDFENHRTDGTILQAYPTDNMAKKLV